jgi:MoaA/NifB/PqqE/SkfB family radical SAM enzyme
VDAVLSRQTFMVMNRCNLSCSYCYYEDGTAEYRARVAPPEQYDAWLRRCARVTTVTDISITGGEPLLRPEFPELLGIAAGHADRVTVFSNATVLTEATVALLARLRCEVHVSIDHVGTGLDDRVRGGTKAALRGLETLRAAGVPYVQVVLVLTSRNWGDAGNVMAFARDAGYGCELLPVSVPAVHPLSLMTLSLSERRELIATIDQHRALLGRPVYYGKVRQFLMTGATPRASRCDAGDNGVFVNSDGEIWVCGRRTRPSLGNIADADPGDVLLAKEAATAGLRPGRCVSVDCLVLT